MSREQDQIISAGVAISLIGQVIGVGAAGSPTATAIWPSIATGGKRAIQVILRPVTNAVWVGLDLPIGQPNDPGAQLSGNVEYVFPIGPDVHTMYSVAPVAGTMLARWVIGG